LNFTFIKACSLYTCLVRSAGALISAPDLITVLCSQSRQNIHHGRSNVGSGARHRDWHHTNCHRDGRACAEARNQNRDHANETIG
ncbi:hypothetical protein BJ875DRAFT_99571, partial [Amylocarpus encephaloides]